MRLLIVGAGSTGGYFGARLAEADQDVTFLVRSAKAEQLRKSGLQVVSPHGDMKLQPTVVTSSAIVDHYDAILLAVKGFQLESALEDVAPAMGPKTMILPMLNGMRHMDTIAKRFSHHNVIGCAVKVATVLEEDGRIIQLSALQDFAYGELDGSETPRIMDLDEIMKKADIGARLSASIHREMWEKWILLASLGAITCLMDGTIGQIQAHPGGKTFALALLNEAITIVSAIGLPPSDAFVSAAKEQLTAEGSPLTSSMFRDIQRWRPIEVESIVGDLVRHGEAVGIASPLLSAAYIYLSIYQSKATGTSL